MEQITETITLDVEESNELAFRLKVEGAESPIKVRLVCESENMSYMFSGRGTQEDGVVQFIVPQMKGKLLEGTYPARVEVLIDNRYFTPVQFNMHFKKTMQVFAESVQVVNTVSKPEIRISAAPIVVSQKPSLKVESKSPVIDSTPSTPISTPKRPAPSKIYDAPPKASSNSLKEKFLRASSEEEDLQEFAKRLLNTVKKK